MYNINYFINKYWNWQWKCINYFKKLTVSENVCFDWIYELSHLFSFHTETQLHLFTLVCYWPVEATIHWSRLDLWRTREECIWLSVSFMINSPCKVVSWILKEMCHGKIVRQIQFVLHIIISDFDFGNGEGNCNS